MLFLFGRGDDQRTPAGTCRPPLPVTRPPGRSLLPTAQSPPATHPATLGRRPFCRPSQRTFERVYWPTPWRGDAPPGRRSAVIVRWSRSAPARCTDNALAGGVG